MDNKAKLIKPDGTEEEIVPENGTDFSLKEIRDILNAPTFELLQSGSKSGNMYLLTVEPDQPFPDEGESHLPKNEKATELWKEWNKPLEASSIYGNVILCPEEMVK